MLAIPFMPPPSNEVITVDAPMFIATSCGVFIGSKGARIDSDAMPKPKPTLALSLATPNTEPAAQAALTPMLNTGIANAMLSGSAIPATNAGNKPPLSIVSLRFIP